MTREGAAWGWLPVVCALGVVVLAGAPAAVAVPASLSPPSPSSSASSASSPEASGEVALSEWGGAVPVVVSVAEQAAELPERALEPLWAESAFEAQALAAESGRRVEVVSRRTGESRVWALPDGTWMEEAFAGPQWVRVAGDGSQLWDWADVDPTLVVGADGLVRPAVYPVEFALTGGGDAEVVLRAGVAGSDVVVELLRGGVLGGGAGWPAPVLEGSRARYEGVAPGVDYVVDVLPAGFEQYFVVHSREAFDAFEAAGGFGWDVRVEGGELAPSESGTFRVLDESGVEVAASPGAFAWDAVEDAKAAHPVLQAWDGEVRVSPGVRVPGLPAAVADAVEEATAGRDLPEAVLMDARLEAPRGRSSEDRPGAVVARVALEVPDSLVEDAVFPLVVDPSLSPHSNDTYVRSDNPSTNYNSSTELLIGTYSSSGPKHRSFIRFNTSALQGKEITSAKLKVFNHHSWSCSSKRWRVYWAGTIGSSTTWNNQPTVHQQGNTSTTTTKGFSSSCPDAAISVTVTTIVRDYWASAGSVNYSFRLTADSETDPFFWKRFYSQNYSTSSKRPSLVYEYNSPPSTPSTLLFTSDDYPTPVSLASSGAVTLAGDDRRPTLRATVSDPDGGQVQAVFGVYEDGYLVASLWAPMVDSGQVSQIQVPFDLRYGAEYTFRVYARDATLSSTGAHYAPSGSLSLGAVPPPGDIPPVCDEAVGASGDDDCEEPS